jgi:capsular exopolysaccharide synthesis family protein
MDVSVTHTDAEIAYQVAKAFEEVAPAWFNGLLNLEISDEETGEEIKVSATANLVKPTNVAIKSEYPSGRGVSFMAALGAFVGAVVMFVICYVRALQDNTVYTDTQLREQFTLPVVGQIPTWDTAQSSSKAKSKRRRTGLLAKKHRRIEVSAREYDGRLLATDTPFAISEAFKVLRTNMCYTSKGDDCAVYGVTSAYVGAGKSLVTANVAIAFAQMGKRVLLIDGDMRCPVQQKIFGLSARAEGLSEMLAGVQKNIDAVISSTAYEGLSVITGGHEPPNPAELLASDNMKRLLEYARERYDVVFVDLPPVGVVTDAGVISDLVTGYVLVVRSSYSDRREIEMSVQTMESLGASLVGFILNDVDLKGRGEYRNHYYGSYGAYTRYEKHGLEETGSRRSKKANK